MGIFHGLRAGTGLLAGVVVGAIVVAGLIMVIFEPLANDPAGGERSTPRVELDPGCITRTPDPQGPKSCAQPLVVPNAPGGRGDDPVASKALLPPTQEAFLGQFSTDAAGTTTRRLKLDFFSGGGECIQGNQQVECVAMLIDFKAKGLGTRFAATMDAPVSDDGSFGVSYWHGMMCCPKYKKGKLVNFNLMQGHDFWLDGQFVSPNLIQGEWRMRYRKHRGDKLRKTKWAKWTVARVVPPPEDPEGFSNRK